MNSASTSLELHSDTGSIADSDIREVDLELAAATALTQIVTISVHQSLVEEPPPIVEGQALTMDIVTTMPLSPVRMRHLWASHPIRCMSSTSTPAPLLVAGPSFPPVTQGASISIKGAPGMPPVPYSSIQSVSAPPASYSAIYSAGAQPYSQGLLQRHAAPCRAQESYTALHFSL